MSDLATRLRALDDHLRDLGSVVVAFSGGADSAFLLAAAVRALGPERVVAATAVSASLPATELDGAAAFARGLGVRHLTPRTDEMSRPGYVANGADRCFHCKAELLHVLAPLAGELGLAVVATGTNADDVVAAALPDRRFVLVEDGALDAQRVPPRVAAVDRDRDAVHEAAHVQLEVGGAGLRDQAAHADDDRLAGFARLDGSRGSGRERLRSIFE